MNIKPLLHGLFAFSLLSVSLLPARAVEAPANPPNLFAAPDNVRPLKIAVYKGPGAGESGIKSVIERARQLPKVKVTTLTPHQVATTDLSKFDVIVFSGGSGSKQGRSIGEEGRANVRRFVENGGGYMGICAGAYLACAGFDWGVGVLNAKTVSKVWKRGRGMMRVELTDEGREIFGEVEGPFTIRYANGPIIKPLGREDLPTYHVAAVFRTEIAENGAPEGVMVDSPAVVYTNFGKGRVITLSPHSENTPGLENVVPRALAWAAGEARH